MCILTGMSCMSTFRFIFQNRTFLCRKKLFSTLLLVQLTDLFLYNSYSSLLFLELGRMRKGVLYPMDPFAQPIRFQSHCWSSAEGQKAVLFRHRFRHQDFYDMLRAFSLLDITSRSVSSYAVWQERSLLIPAISASWFSCDVWHTLVDMVILSTNTTSRRIAYVTFSIQPWECKFAYRLLQPVRYCGYFQLFADVLSNFGSPFPNIIGIIDGNFMDICRPMGLGNFWANKDLQELYYSGKEKAHGLKFLAVIFPNGMICLYDFGSSHDGRLLRESGWIQFLVLFERRTGLRMSFFGDAAFRTTRWCMNMLKGNLTRQKRTFNSIMSCIRIAAENGFAGQHNCFNFLSFKSGHKLGARNVARMYMCATFFMNVRSTYYGSQFSEATGCPTMTVDEFLALWTLYISARVGATCACRRHW